MFATICERIFKNMKFCTRNGMLFSVQWHFNPLVSGIDIVALTKFLWKQMKTVGKNWYLYCVLLITLVTYLFIILINTNGSDEFISLSGLCLISHFYWTLLFDIKTTYSWEWGLWSVSSICYWFFFVLVVLHISKLTSLLDCFVKK